MEKITDSMKEFFERIRDERTMHANTANRIGNAFLMILNYLLDSDTPYLRKDREDSTRYLLTLLAGAVIGESGRIRLNPDGSIICDSINVEGSAVFNELVFNHQNVLEGDTYFSDRGIVEKVEALSEGRYRIFLRKEYEEASVPFQPFDVLKCSMNNLDAARTFKDSWVRVDSVDLPANSMDVTLYDHDDVPGGTNYVPEPSARITRWGNQKNEKRQDVFFVSGAEGRFLFLQGVTQPKLTDGNYSAFIGLPPELEVLKNLPIDKRQPYIYARGLIVQDIMYVDYMGNPQYTQRDLGTWKEDGVYIHGWDEKAKGWYSDRVWWGGCYWQCSVEKATAGKAPRFNNADWACLMGAHDLSLSVKSAGGDRFPEGEDWNTTLNAELWNAEMQIMENEIPKSSIRWTRNSGDQVADQTWNDNHPAGTLGLSLPVSSPQDVGDWNADSNVTFQCDITLDAIGVTVSGTCQLSGFRESTLYTWVKYADSADGAGMSDNPEGKMYIGLAYNKTTPESSNNPQDYSWSLFGGTIGKSAAKGYVTSNDIAIPTDANGIVTKDFQIGNTFSLMVDGKNCTDLKVTMDGTPATNAFKAQLNQLWLTISSSKGAELGLLAYTLHFTVKGVLDNVTYSDVVTILVRPNRAGTDGKNLTRVSNFYKWGDSGTEAPSDGYIENAIPQHTEGLDYLWNYEVCYNDAGETISTSEKTCIGNFARGIESITEYYQIGTAEKPDKPISVDTIDASGWQTTMPSLTAEKRYLWNLEVVRFTDGTYSISEVHLAGAQGESITIEQKLVYYAISASGTSTPPDSWFSDAVKEPTIEKPYLWTCVSIRYSDTTVVKYYTVARRGENGAPGRNLTKVVNYYKWGANGTEAPSDGYTNDNIPPHTDGFDYLWNYEVCYSDNDVLSQSGKTCIGYFPKDGKPGKEGKGIASITEYYQIGTERKPTKGITVNSDNVLDTTGWKTTMDPTTNENRFVWNQEVIQFTDGKYSISAIHLAGAQGDDGIDGADGALPNLFGYDTKVECLVGHHNVVHTKTGFALVLDSISDDDTSSDRYCLLRIKDITAGEGTYSISGYITHGRGGKFEFDCGDVTPQTMYLTANKRTRFEKKFVLPKNSYKHVDFEFFAGGYIVNIEELKIERTDNTVSECTPFVTLAHDSITQKQNILLDTNFTKTNDRTIWNVFSGDIVENAYNGLSAFHYKDSRSATITTAVEVLSQKFVGKLKPSTWYTLSMYTKVKGKVILYIGSNVTRRFGQTGKNKGVDAVLCDEYIASMSDRTNTHQLEESTEYKRHSITFLTAPDLTNADERMYFYIWAQAEIYVTMLKLEECEKPTDWQLNEADRKGEKGDNGKTGKPLAGPTIWDSSVKYMSGKSDEAYQSIVINPKYPKQMYLCGYSHSGKEPSSTTSTSSVDTCTEDQPWVQVAYQDFVATKVLFAERGKIENLDITNATIQGTITDMAVSTQEEWDAITNVLVPKLDKNKTEVDRYFQIVDPSKAGSYFIPTIAPISNAYDRGPQIVFLPTYNPTAYDIITCKTTQTGIYKTYNIPKYQIAGTHIRITKGNAPIKYSRWAYLEDAEYKKLWTSGAETNRQIVRNIYNLGTLICADNKIFREYNGNDEQTHEIQGKWYYGSSDYKHGRFSVNGTVARMLWLMPGQTVELVSQIEEIYDKKCLVWSVVNSSDFTAVNVNADLHNHSDTYEPIKFYGESSVLSPVGANPVDNWEDCFLAHRKIDNLLLGGETKKLPRLFVNRNNLVHNSDNYEDNDNPIAEFYLP